MGRPEGEFPASSGSAITLTKGEFSASSRIAIAPTKGKFPTMTHGVPKAEQTTIFWFAFSPLRDQWNI